MSTLTSFTYPVVDINWLYFSSFDVDNLHFSSMDVTSTVNTVDIQKLLHFSSRHPSGAFTWVWIKLVRSGQETFNKLNKQWLHCRKWQFLIAYMVHSWPSWLKILVFAYSLENDILSSQRQCVVKQYNLSLMCIYSWLGLHNPSIPTFAVSWAVHRGPPIDVWAAPYGLPPIFEPISNNKDGQAIGDHP